MFVRESLPRERCLLRNERTITVNYYLVDCKVFIEMRRNREKSFAFYFVDFNGNNSYSMQKAMRQFPIFLSCFLFSPTSIRHDIYKIYYIWYIFIKYKLKKLILFSLFCCTKFYTINTVKTFQSKLLRVIKFENYILLMDIASRAKIESRISLISCYRMYIFYYMYIEHFHRSQKYLEIKIYLLTYKRFNFALNREDIDIKQRIKLSHSTSFNCS